MALSAVEFLRRFLLHVFPKGFVRIRRRGWWTNRHGQRQLDRYCDLLRVAPAAVEPAREADQAYIASTRNLIRHHALVIPCGFLRIPRAVG
jgi:Putative transposase